MTITTQKFSVGTAVVELVPPSNDSQRIWLENLEPGNTLGEFSRDGYAYVVSRYLTIPNGGTATFSFTTGATGAQFDFWDLQSETSSMLSELVEGATITTTGTAVQAYNMNRAFSDTYQAVLQTASAVTGGTVVISEYSPASAQSSGGAYSGKVVTLKPNTQYGFRFIDKGGTGTNAHIQIGFVEKYNGYNDLSINGPLGNTVRLRGGEKLQLDLQQGEGLTGVAQRAGVTCAVMRQD
jgi:hypothetical protein